MNTDKAPFSSALSLNNTHPQTKLHRDTQLDTHTHTHTNRQRNTHTTKTLND